MNGRINGIWSGGRDDTFMQRLLIGARLDYGDNFGAYVQLGSSLATPRDRGRKPTDEDHAYLGQGYVDLKLPTAYGLGTPAGRPPGDCAGFAAPDGHPRRPQRAPFFRRRPRQLGQG